MNDYAEYVDLLRRHLGAEFDVTTSPVENDIWLVFAKRLSDNVQKYVCLIGPDRSRIPESAEAGATQLRIAFKEDHIYLTIKRT